MFIRSFRSKLILRVLLLTATLLLFSYLVLQMDFIFVPFAIIFLGIYQVFSLIRFAEKTNRDLGRFLLSIKHDDMSQAFTSQGLGSSFSDLKDGFNEVMRKLQQTRSEKEVHARYLETIIQHVGIGLLAFKPKGKVDFINNAAKKLLKVTGLRDVRDMKVKSLELVDTFLNLKHGEKKLVKFSDDGEGGYLSIFAHAFVLKDEEYILVSIQNIQEELEEKEMEAWQNLIRVLTHEIMNSITPISSMTATLVDMLKKNGKENDGIEENTIDPEDLEDMLDALEAIHRRSEGLMNFVGTYRNMTLIPTPKFRILQLSDFFKRMEKLMSNKLTDADISFKWSVLPETLELTADHDLMEQVMINLLLNAISAVTGRENPQITVSAFLAESGAVVITVEDNGVGIVEEALEKIFIPFFTTKKQGSGIGLSLSRQILRLHRATIRAQSIPDKTTIFTLRF